MMVAPQPRVSSSGCGASTSADRFVTASVTSRARSRRRSRIRKRYGRSKRSPGPIDKGAGGCPAGLAGLPRDKELNVVGRGGEQRLGYRAPELGLGDVVRSA